MYNLKTLSPEELDWLKDCDVTWLYGPLQHGSRSFHPKEPGPSPRVSLCISSPLIKSILKKRSKSEMMLLHSPRLTSLLKPTTAHKQEQNSKTKLRSNIPAHGKI
ncbi:hypothetical protein RJ55_06806 [Drechmeria coniospora]|nr:hypothetical protein RJ55_06806 [Drechmeria coniospora]